jgi:hypothetical protein
MTDEQINAAIAEACGIVGKDKYGPLYQTSDGWVVDCPQFATDLNAMHSAEKVLAPKNWDRFSEKWWNYYHHLLDGDVHKTIHATARQRAEAFLRTLGKWEEAE